MSVLLCLTLAMAAPLICVPAQHHAAPWLTPLAKCTQHLQGERKDKHHTACGGLVLYWIGHAGGLGLFFFHRRRTVDAV